MDDLIQWRDAVGILASKISVDGRSQMFKDEGYWVYQIWLDYMKETIIADTDSAFIRGIRDV